jgi:hypothetical protein
METNANVEQKQGASDLITKKILISSGTYKELKKRVIDLDLDTDGKISPEMLGIAIESLLKRN